MTPASPEYQMIRTYLDWVLDVPWSTTTEDRLDPVVGARRCSTTDHYDLDKVKERIVEYLAVQQLEDADTTPTAQIKGPILCFVGPPGVGKTSLGQSIARAMNRKFVRISLGGVRDEAEIRGHRRTYIGAIPGRIVQALKQAGAMNPVFMLDEIDKISAGFQGDPAAALLEVLDSGAEPLVPRPLSRDQHRSVARAVHRHRRTSSGTIHPALLDRMEIISLSGYSEEEKLHIARRYLIRAAARGARARRRPWSSSTTTAIRRITSDYTREARRRAISSARSARSRARLRRGSPACRRNRRDTPLQPMPVQ